MTLFVACLIIYQFDMNLWLYLVAAGLWLVQVTAVRQGINMFWDKVDVITQQLRKYP